MQPLFGKVCYVLTALTLAVFGLNTHDAGTVEVPYSGKFDLVFNGFSSNPPTETGTYTFTGEVSLLGKSTGDGSFEKNLNTGVVTSNTCTLTAANGDEVFCAVTYKLVPTDTPNISTLDVTFQLTDGTGRFDGVTGDGKGTGSYDSSTNQGSFTVTGVGFLKRPAM
jgi:hypothetical protein